jgi:hypothetical protein
MAIIVAAIAGATKMFSVYSYLVSIATLGARGNIRVWLRFEKRQCGGAPLPVWD